MSQWEAFSCVASAIEPILKRTLRGLCPSGMLCSDTMFRSGDLPICNPEIAQI